MRVQEYSLLCSVDDVITIVIGGLRQGFYIVSKGSL